MADAEKRKKVIRGLECHLGKSDLKCEDCPYRDALFSLECSIIMQSDALDLLKEQEGVKPISGYGCYICGVCKNPLTSVSQKFCSVCGKAVKWDD